MRRPMPPWGDSQGTPRADASTGAGRTPLSVGEDGGDEAGQMMSMGDVGGGMPPLVMLRLLKALGKI